jgi:hypothetical protein
VEEATVTLGQAVIFSEDCLAHLDGASSLVTGRIGMRVSFLGGFMRVGMAMGMSVRVAVRVRVVFAMMMSRAMLVLVVVLVLMVVAMPMGFVRMPVFMLMVVGGDTCGLFARQPASAISTHWLISPVILNCGVRRSFDFQ